MARRRTNPTPTDDASAALVVDVSVTRGVGTIAARVPLKDAFTVLVDMLDGMRRALEHYPELLDAGPDTVPGGMPASVPETYWEDRRRNGRPPIGFYRG